MPHIKNDLEGKDSEIDDKKWEDKQYFPDSFKNLAKWLKDLNQDTVDKILQAI